MDALRRMTACLIFLAAGALPSVVLAGDAHDACTRGYLGTLQRYSQADVLSVTLDTLHTQHCGSQSSASDKQLSAGLESAFKAVPLVGRWASRKRVTNSSEFCKAYEQEQASVSVNKSFVVEPIVAAQENFNQCMETANRSSTAITHLAEPGQVAIAINKYDSQKLFSLQGVNTKTFQCRIAGSSQLLAVNSRLDIDKPSTIQCTRSGEKRPEGDTYYPPDAIIVGTSQGVAYRVSLAEETVLGPAKQSKAKAEIDRLRPIAARADELERSILSDRLELRPFYRTSGSDRGFVTGPEFNWYELNGKTLEQIAEIAKDRLCRDAKRARAIAAASMSGDCCGRIQYVLVCSYADPEAGR